MTNPMIIALLAATGGVYLYSRRKKKMSSRPIGPQVGIGGVDIDVSVPTSTGLRRATYVGKDEVLTYYDTVQRVHERSKINVPRWNTTPWEISVQITGVPQAIAPKAVAAMQVKWWGQANKAKGAVGGVTKVLREQFIATMNESWLIDPIPRKTSGPYNCENEPLFFDAIKTAACSVHWTNLHNTVVQVVQDPVSYLFVAFWRWGSLCVGPNLDSVFQAGVQVAHTFAVDGEPSYAHLEWDAL